ncbi:MAG: hypothetical protein QOD90_1102, partial [Mycobacterium sp.]|nr:hypothetical protein [Mycobacterium sp.]
LAHGNDRLMCLCDTDDCPAPNNPASSGVVVYVIAHQDTITNPEPDEPTGPSGSAGPGDTVADADAADRCAENAGDEAKSTNSEPVAPVDECAGLDGVAPPMFTKPLRDVTLAEAMTPTPGQPSQIRPGAILGGGFLPGPLTRRATRNAKIRPIVHPGQAPPEPRYTPSKRLAEFVRCRDLTCRFPGCHQPATSCDVDHTIPWPYGATGASNLKCLCRFHHLLKTFWGGDGGWRDRQMPDGTIHWTAPDGRTYTTTPASRLLFPTLSAPTAPIVATGTPPPAHTAGLTMPRRRTTRAEDRARRINDERENNRTATELPAEPTTPEPTTEAAADEAPDTSIPPF